MIGIIDYGLGNLHSVFKALKRIGSVGEIVKNSAVLHKYDKLILPGVGNFEIGMKNLREADLIEALQKQVVENEIPILGICLGMQLLTTSSQEGEVEGLDLIKAHAIHFKNLGIPAHLKIPHIGWNNIRNKIPSQLLEGVDDEMLYFVHSYAVICSNPSEIICETEYGTVFHSGFQKGNIFGVQFHPEKSHKAGLRILKNFADIKMFRYK